MTIGVGGKSQEQALADLRHMTHGTAPIGEAEYRARIAKAQAHMRASKIDAVYLNAGSSLLYFTGVHWHPSERMVGAILPATGALEYIAPKFEEGTLNDFMAVRTPSSSLLREASILSSEAFCESVSVRSLVARNSPAPMPPW